MAHLLPAAGVKTEYGDVFQFHQVFENPSAKRMRLQQEHRQLQRQRQQQQQQLCPQRSINCGFSDTQCPSQPGRSSRPPLTQPGLMCSQRQKSSEQNTCPRSRGKQVICFCAACNPKTQFRRSTSSCGCRDAPKTLPRENSFMWKFPEAPQSTQGSQCQLQTSASCSDRGRSKKNAKRLAPDSCVVIQQVQSANIMC